MSDSFTIILDSTSDLAEEVKKKYNFTVVPAHVIIGEKDYIDGVTIKREEFIHELLHSEEKITTTQPSPLDFINAFTETLKKSERILFLGVSSKLSATYQNAVIASRRVDKEKITCIDTLSVSQALTLMAIHASKRREQGIDFDLIVKEINQMIESAKLYFLVEDLTFLHRGGRIGRAQHLIGSLLNMKPLLHLVEGEIDSFDKVRGMDAGYEKIVELITKHAQELKDFVLTGLYGMDNPKFEKLADSLKTKIQPLYYTYYPIGPGVMCHVGPKVEGLAIIKVPENAVDAYKK